MTKGRGKIKFKFNIAHGYTQMNADLAKIEFKPSLAHGWTRKKRIYYFCKSSSKPSDPQIMGIARINK